MDEVNNSQNKLITELRKFNVMSELLNEQSTEGTIISTKLISKKSGTDGS